MHKKGKKIAIIAMAIALNGEKGYTRFAFLADMLAKAGYDIDLITSSFQHWEKKQRDKHVSGDTDFGYRVILIDEPGYKRNIDVRRIISHHTLAGNLKTYLDGESEYDLIYSVIPPNNTAKIAGQYAAKHGIPFIVDVEDLWPEAMKMVFDVPLISNLLYGFLEKDAEDTYKLANGVIGTSDEYRKRPFRKRKENIESYTVYVGIDLKKFDQGADLNRNTVSKKDGEFWVTYAGTLGASYDLKTLIEAAGRLKSMGYDQIKIKILGDGPMREELRRLSDAMDCSVEFTGYMPFEEMAAYLKKSDILINSFVKKAPQSIVNKIGDYLAAGKPMINTCSSREFKDKVEKDGFGVNVVAEDVRKLSRAIEALYQNPQMRREMGERARKIAETEFNRRFAYRKIEALIEHLLNTAIQKTGTVSEGQHGE